MQLGAELNSRNMFYYSDKKTVNPYTFQNIVVNCCDVESRGVTVWQKSFNDKHFEVLGNVSDIKRVR
jgi:hypothetical protein